MRFIPNAGHWTPTKKSRELPLHHNPGLEIVFVARGEVEWVYAGRRVTSRPGSFVFGWPWEEHGIAETVMSQCELYWVLVALAKRYPSPSPTLRFHKSLALAAGEEASLMKALRRRRTVVASILAAELMRRIAEEQSHPTDAHEAVALSMVRLLLLELARLCRQPRARSVAASGDQRVAEFLSELQRECGEEWTLESMAARCGLGRTRFSAIVSATTGDSPLRLLNRYRVATAGRMLQETKQPITTVGFACGFNSSQYFARVFREFTGYTPSEWRRPTPPPST